METVPFNKKLQEIRDNKKKQDNWFKRYGSFMSNYLWKNRFTKVKPKGNVIYHRDGRVKIYKKVRLARKPARIILNADKDSLTIVFAKGVSVLIKNEIIYGDPIELAGLSKMSFEELEKRIDRLILEIEMVDKLTK